ncbi:hypothetical protein EBZ39_07425 [bacterium]|nr:hypothetical protein [bacterium]
MSTISAGTAATNALVATGDTTGNLIFASTGVETARIDTSGRFGIGVTPSGSGLLELKAGTTSVAPVKLNSGTNLTSAAAGIVEYDGKVFYATPQGTQRGVVPGMQFYRLDSSVAGANVNTAQNIFGVGVTLSGSTVYAFQSIYALSKTTGTTSHSIQSGFGGNATLNNIAYVIQQYQNNSSLTSALVASSYQYIQTASATSDNIGARTNASQYSFFVVSGTVSINAGGTFIPQYTLTSAPGGAYTTAAGSYFLIYPIGSSGANISVGTWT